MGPNGTACATETGAADTGIGVRQAGCCERGAYATWTCPFVHIIET